MATAADILGASRTTKVLSRWAKHYQQLCTERDRLLERDCSAPEASSAKLDDLGEAAADESARCMSLVAARATQANIVDVLEAIRRIERGTYGVCELTGKPIETERLKAIPWTRYSLEGQAELERSGRHRLHALPSLEPFAEPMLANGDEDGGEEGAEKAEE